MKFAAGDVIDSALTTAMSHEMLLCQDSFNRFAKIAETNIMGRTDKATKLALYGAYTRFLHHLYEFYVACYKRERKSLDSIPGAELDRLLNGEVRRQLRNRRDAIDHGYAPSWENHRSVYEIDVPNDFSLQWRSIRNRTAHVNIKRARPMAEIRLVDFYKQSHRFIYILYSAVLPHWSVRDIDAINWKDIEEFNLAVTPD